MHFKRSRTHFLDQGPIFLIKDPFSIYRWGFKDVGVRLMTNKNRLFTIRCNFLITIRCNFLLFACTFKRSRFWFFANSFPLLLRALFKLFCFWSKPNPFKKKSRSNIQPLSLSTSKYLKSPLILKYHRTLQPRPNIINLSYLIRPHASL